MKNDRLYFIRILVPILIIIGILFGGSPLDAGQISFEIPIDCNYGQDCFIQNYFDDDPGPDRKDYACGRLSYDGHTGTDFRLNNLPAMEKGVPVLASAPGVVKGTRNDMRDVSIKQNGSEKIKGKEAGNGVVIDHGDGWVTQYSHLKRGSVMVKPGQQVKAGERLGVVGLSGMTEFPHVEFAVRYRGKPIDPFVGVAGWSDCGNTAGALWSRKALQTMPYIPTGALNAGFSHVKPEAEKARGGEYDAVAFPADAEMFVFWVDLFGAQQGDRQEFNIIGPGDTSLASRSQILDTSNVSWFAFAGCRKPAGGWMKGVYLGTYRLTRQGKAIVSISRQIEM